MDPEKKFAYILVNGSSTNFKFRGHWRRFLLIKLIFEWLRNLKFAKNSFTDMCKIIMVSKWKRQFSLLMLSYGQNRLFHPLGFSKNWKNRKFLHCDSARKIISQFLHFYPKKRHWIEKSHKRLFTPTQQSRIRENYFSSQLFSLTHVRSVSFFVSHIHQLVKLFNFGLSYSYCYLAFVNSTQFIMNYNWTVKTIVLGNRVWKRENEIVTLMMVVK